MAEQPRPDGMGDAPSSEPSLPDDLTPEESRNLALTGAKTALAVLAGALAARTVRSFRFRLPRLRGRRFRYFGFGVLIAVMSITTCSFGVDTASLTSAYGAPVPTSVDDATRFLTRSADALSGLQRDNSLRVTITESEATSVLSLGLMVPELARVTERIPPEEIRSATDLEALRERVHRESDALRREALERMSLPERLAMKLDPRIRTGDVQIRFRGSGEVVVAGYVQAWRFRQPGMFVVAPAVRNGELQLDFVEGRLGRLPAPEVVFDLFGRLLSSAILLGRDYARITEISVGEGTLRLAGRLGG